MTLKIKMAYFSIFRRFEIILLPPDVELSRQAENDLVEQFRHQM